MQNRPIVELRGQHVHDGRAVERPKGWPSLIVAAACVIAVSSGLVVLRGAGPASHADRVGVTTAVLSGVSLAATVTYLAVLIALHVLPTGYSPVRHAVSDYAVGRYGSLFTVGLYVSSVSVLTLAFAVLSGIGTPPLAARDVAYLLLIPLTRIGMTLFPTDLEGQRLSRRGLLHYLFAVAAFTLTYLAVSDMTPALRTLDTPDWISGPLHWMSWIVGPALALVVITMVRPLRRVFGLFERLFLVSTNVWFGLVALLVITRLS